MIRNVLYNTVTYKNNSQKQKMDNQQPQPRHAAKSFYLFMCAILGALLFSVLQRALTLIYLLLLNSDSARFSFGLSDDTLIIINYSTLIMAIIFGFWYGIWLGLYWYKVVYEDGHGGLFHGFKGHWLHQEGIKSKPGASSSPIQPMTKTKPNIVTAPVVTAAPAPQSKTIKPVARTSSDPRDPLGAWDLDDLMNEKTVIGSNKVIKVTTKSKVMTKPRNRTGAVVASSTKAVTKRRTAKKVVTKLKAV